MVKLKKTEKFNENSNNGNTNHNNTDINIINSIKSEDKDIVAHYTIVNSESPDRVKFAGIDDNDSICSEESNTASLPPIPDGGWGWVVVASSFLVSACVGGLAFSFGLLHEEFTQYFETTQSKTSWIGSIFISTPLLVGPIMSALVDRYGCRIMTIIAGLLSTIGLLLAAISNSVEMLCLTFGLIGGLGMGILYVTGIVSVAFWFDKRRNLAVSLASCGVGFGTIIYSPMTHYLLDIYDWRNTVILLAGTFLNMCVCGALMKDPEWLETKQKRERKLSKAKSSNSSSAGFISSRSVRGKSPYLDSEELKALLTSGENPECILATLATSIAEVEELEATTQANVDQTTKRMHSTFHLPTFVQHNEKVPAEVIDKLMKNKRLYNIILQNYPDVLTRRHSGVNVDLENTENVSEHTMLLEEIKAKKPIERTDNDKEVQIEAVKTSNTDAIKRNVVARDSKVFQQQQRRPSWFRQISTDHHYLKDVPLHKTTMMHRGAMMSITKYKLKASSLPDMYRNSTWSLYSESNDEMEWCNRFIQAVKSMFDFKMFTEFHFLMFNLASLILAVWYIVPYFFLNSYMNEMKVEGGPMMISVIGVTSSIGTVALGWAGDLPWVNVTKTYAICIITCGTSVAAYPLFITNYWILTIISAVFGFSFASAFSYTPTILMELMPIDKFTVAYGLILLSSGVGHIVGPPIAGLLYDLTRSWDLTFCVAGFWLIISGILVGVIAYTEDLRLCGSSPLMKEAEEARTGYGPMKV